MHCKDITVPKDGEVTGYVNGENSTRRAISHRAAVGNDSV